MGLECVISLDFDDTIYTNIDYVDEKRRKKCSLMGIDPEVTQYKYKDIPWIVDKCDKVIVINSVELVSKTTLGFERLFKLIKKSDIEKIVIYGNHTFIWKIENSVTYLQGYDAILGVPTKVSRLSPDELRLSDWTKGLMLSWMKLYYSPDSDKIREQAILHKKELVRKLCNVTTETLVIYGRSAYNGTSTLFGGNSHERLRVNKEKFYRLECKKNFLDKTEFYNLTIDSKYKISLAGFELVEGETRLIYYGIATLIADRDIDINYWIKYAKEQYGFELKLVGVI